VLTSKRLVPWVASRYARGVEVARVVVPGLAGVTATIVVYAIERCDLLVVVA
jgi:hypothetical protein